MYRYAAWKALVSFITQRPDVFKNKEDIIMDREALKVSLEKWCKKLRISTSWDVKLEFVEEQGFRKTGDIKIDCHDKKAIVMLNVRRSYCSRTYASEAVSDGSVDGVSYHKLFLRRFEGI